MFPPTSVWSEAPIVPSTDRDRTVTPRTTPSVFTVLYPSSSNAVVVMSWPIMRPLSSPEDDTARAVRRLERAERVVDVGETIRARHQFAQLQASFLMHGDELRDVLLRLARSVNGTNQPLLLHDERKQRDRRPRVGARESCDDDGAALLRARKRAGDRRGAADGIEHDVGASAPRPFAHGSRHVATRIKGVRRTELFGNRQRRRTPVDGDDLFTARNCRALDDV